MILVISNHNSFRALFDKIASVYFIRKIYSYTNTGNGLPREPALCQLYRHSFVPYIAARISAELHLHEFFEHVTCTYDRGSSSGVEIRYLFPVFWLTSCVHTIARKRQREKSIY